MMLLRFVVALSCLLLGGWTHGVGYIPHTYYMSTGGSDGNPGTSGSPWQTANHAVNCGDTIIAVAGTYSSSAVHNGNWGTVSNCPSTAGIYFAKVQCAGPYVTSCNVNDGNGDFIITASNWAVIGWTVTGGSGCFSTSPLSANTNLHHVAFINVVVNGCTVDGVSVYTNTGGSPQYGVDYFACVGCVIYAAATGTTHCYSGVSIYEPANYDAKTGTHIYLAGIFSYANVDPATCQGGPATDGEGIIFDDWKHSQQTGSAYTGQGVIEQSMLLGNGNPGFEINPSLLAPVYVLNSTTWGNMQNTAQTGTYTGELLFYQGIPATATGNIFQATESSNAGGSVYACFAGEETSASTIANNVCFGVSGQNTHVSDNVSFSFGTNVTTTPSFANATLPGAPTCSTYATSVACMVGMSVVANFTATAGAAAGLGYQSPGPCMADAYFPPWLAGIIPIGLITQPCGTN